MTKVRMGYRSKMATTDNSDEESGDAFTDGDFGDSDEETVIERSEEPKKSHIPVNETVNTGIQKTNGEPSSKIYANGLASQPKINGHKNGDLSSDTECRSNGDVGSDIRRDSHGDQNPSIVGIIGDQHNYVRKALLLSHLLCVKYLTCILEVCVTMAF